MRRGSLRARLIDIREEIAGIRETTRGASLATFAASWTMKRAIEHGLLIIAEAAKHLPPSMKENHPEVPWRNIHALGNMLRHEYRRIDPEVLWSIVTEHLVALDKTAGELLETIEEN